MGFQSAIAIVEDVCVAYARELARGADCSVGVCAVVRPAARVGLPVAENLHVFAGSRGHLRVGLVGWPPLLHLPEVQARGRGAQPVHVMGDEN